MLEDPLFLFDYRNSGGNNIRDLFNKFGDEYDHRTTTQKQDFVAQERQTPVHISAHIAANDQSR